MKFIEVSKEPFHELRYRTSGRRGQVRKVILPFYKATVDDLPKGVSAFVITSDLQGREIDKKSNRLVGEAVAEELALLVELNEIPKVTFVALAGDLFDYPELHKMGGTGDVTSVWNAFANKFEFVVGVHGNHDKVDESKLKKNTYILDGSSTNIQGVKVGGVSGIIGRSDRNQRKTEEEFIRKLKKVTTHKNDIVLLHQGPDDHENNQIGEPRITEHLNSKKDLVVAFGHFHWEVPFINFGKNQVLNVDNRLYVVSVKST